MAKLRVTWTEHGWAITERRNKQWYTLQHRVALDAAMGWATLYLCERGAVALRKRSETCYELRRVRAFR